MSNNKNVLFLREEYGDGQGTYIYPNGEKYEGDWKNGKYPGHGTYSWSNRNKYEGQFKNWNWHGHGKFSVPNGHHILGQFKEQKPWDTIEYDKNGVIVGKIVNGVKTIEDSRQVTPKLEVDAAV